MQINNPLPQTGNTVQIGGAVTLQVQTIPTTTVTGINDAVIVGNAALTVTVGTITQTQVILTNTHATAFGRFATTAPTATKGFRLAPGQTAVIDTSGSINGIAETATTIILAIASLP